MSEALWKSEVDIDSMGGFEVAVPPRRKVIKVYSSGTYDPWSARGFAKALMAAADYVEAHDHE